MTKASCNDLFVLASFRLPMLKGIEDEGIKDVLSACHELEEMGDKRGGETRTENSVMCIRVSTKLRGGVERTLQCNYILLFLQRINKSRWINLSSSIKPVFTRSNFFNVSWLGWPEFERGCLQVRDVTPSATLITSLV